MLHSYSGPPARWLVTGAAGFIGSHLVEALLDSGHAVVGIDNFATGHQHNLDDIARRVGSAWTRFEMVRADICDTGTVEKAMSGIDYVMHNAALGSVPRSIDAPLATITANIDGFARILDAARRSKVKRFVYASSSSVYGDHPALPKLEHTVGKPLSPYAATKCVNEQLADIYARTYGMRCIGLRYFNIFGPRQDPAGAYAAVIPRWVSALVRGTPVVVYGDGQTSRDFCYVGNAVQANLRAATFDMPEPEHMVFNVAVGQQTTLTALFEMIRELLVLKGVGCEGVVPTFQGFRSGDVRHSLASIEKARNVLGYMPSHEVRAGLAEALPWYLENP